MSSNNQAAWLEAVAQPLKVKPSDFPKPGNGEVLLRNYAAAVNPIDWKMQDYGIMVPGPNVILGHDVAGEVIDVGEGVTNFKKGDRVFAKAYGAFTSDPRKGAYQENLVVLAASTAKLPDSVSYAAGSVLPTAFETAVIALSDEFPKGLGLPLPSFDPKPSGKTIVLWGGSSSVGLIAAQIAKAAGIKVIATASPRNFDLCRSTGVSEVFDYNSKSVVDDVVQAVRSSGGEFGGVLDCISEASTYPHTLAILEKLGGGNLAVLTPIPEGQKFADNVKATQVFGNGPFVHPHWKDFITPALEKGIVRPLPEPWVVGKGLEAVQAGIDASRKGVSAKKIVIEF